MCSDETFELSPRDRRFTASRLNGRLFGYEASDGSRGTETSMSFMGTTAGPAARPTVETRMIAQRQSVQSRLKCCGEKGLTCPRGDAYDWLFVFCAYWETRPYEIVAGHSRPGRVECSRL